MHPLRSALRIGHVGNWRANPHCNPTIGAVAAHSACAGWRHRQAGTKFVPCFTQRHTQQTQRTFEGLSNVRQLPGAVQDKANDLLADGVGSARVLHSREQQLSVKSLIWLSHNKTSNRGKTKRPTCRRTTNLSTTPGKESMPGGATDMAEDRGELVLRRSNPTSRA